MRINVDAKDCVVYRLSPGDNFPVCIFSGGKDYLEELLKTIGSMGGYFWTMPDAIDYRKFMGKYVVARKCDVEPASNELGEVAP